MATNPIFRYPLDPTGTSPDNRVAGETHTLPNRPVRGLAPNYGMFFVESLVITDVNTNTPLNNTQFRCVELQELPTARYGKAICAVILITDTSVSNNISLTYQPLGGTYSDNTDALIDMINNLDLEDRPVSWPGILNRPDEFDPAPHFHDSGDIYGMEYVVHAINRLRQAILIGDEAAHDELRRYIDTFVTTMTASVTALTNRVNAHEINVGNPHGTTKAQVSLGNVENYPIATQLQAETGDSNVIYMTALRVKQAITSQAGNLLTTHTNRTDNPHGTTKAQVSLGSVENYPIASQSQAEAGTLDTVYMTALKVKQAITSQAIGPLNTHTGRTDNPHGTTKAQVGLSDVLNYGMASNTEAVSGVSNALYMSPLRVKEAITSQAIGPLNTHTGRTDNPHSTTKAQVGLSLVENYPIATVAEATTNAATTTNRYMTPALVRQAITMYSVPSDHTHTFTSLTGKPSTLAGYGVSSVDVTGLIRTTNLLRVHNGATTGAAYCEVTSSSYSFCSATGSVQATIDSTSNITGTNVGTLNVKAATVNFTGAVSAAGDFTYSASDQRLKKNVRAIENAREKVKSIGGYVYDWDLEACEAAGFKPENSSEHGLIAQQVQGVLPEVVVPTAFNDKFYTVRYHRVVPLLSAALCEVIDDNQSLRQELQSLTRQVEKLARLGSNMNIG